ncbi:MAG: hypothetical protein IJO93_06505 [Clostridia bacterium]|nr:hypothetical protein [Clostridia bacterium]
MTRSIWRTVLIVSVFLIGMVAVLTLYFVNEKSKDEPENSRFVHGSVVETHAA